MMLYWWVTKEESYDKMHALEAAVCGVALEGAVASGISDPSGNLDLLTIGTQSVEAARAECRLSWKKSLTSESSSNTSVASIPWLVGLIEQADLALCFQELKPESEFVMAWCMEQVEVAGCARTVLQDLGGISMVVFPEYKRIRLLLSIVQ
ncbi:hypothetical protein ACLOJK_035768 [Asimina triloba]